MFAFLQWAQKFPASWSHWCYPFQQFHISLHNSFCSWVTQQNIETKCASSVPSLNIAKVEIIFICPFKEKMLFYFLGEKKCSCFSCFFPLLQELISNISQYWMYLSVCQGGKVLLCPPFLIAERSTKANPWRMCWEPV